MVDPGGIFSDPSLAHVERGDLRDPVVSDQPLIGPFNKEADLAATEKYFHRQNPVTPMTVGADNRKPDHENVRILVQAKPTKVFVGDLPEEIGYGTTYATDPDMGLTAFTTCPSGPDTLSMAEVLEEFGLTDFEINMQGVYDDAMDLCLKKHKDYGPKNISQSPGGPLNGLRVRMWDKIARANNLIDSGATPENESLRDTYVDILNYAAIAIMVLNGDWPSE